MRINRVSVEQIVLHLPHDATEFRQVVAQDAVASHATQLRCQFVRTAQNFQKGLFVVLVGPKGVVYR